MKKQIKKLSLNKRTISNLNTVEMNQKIGGNMPGPTQRGLECGTQHGNTCNQNCYPTQNGHTCNNNCY